LTFAVPGRCGASGTSPSLLSTSRSCGTVPACLIVTVLAFGLFYGYWKGSPRINTRVAGVYPSALPLLELLVVCGGPLKNASSHQSATTSSSQRCFRCYCISNSLRNNRLKLQCLSKTSRRPARAMLHRRPPATTIRRHGRVRQVPGLAVRSTVPPAAAPAAAILWRKSPRLCCSTRYEDRIEPTEDRTRRSLCQ
jgi:hypothetical protein